VTEAELQAQVVALLVEAGAIVPPYHTHDSRRSAPGFPDVVAWLPGRVVVVECKAAPGRLTPEQEAHLGAASAAGALAMVVRPATLPLLRAALGLGRERPRTEPRVPTRARGSEETREAARALGPAVLAAYDAQYGG